MSPKIHDDDILSDSGLGNQKLLKNLSHVVAKGSSINGLKHISAIQLVELKEITNDQGKHKHIAFAFDIH